MIKKSHRIPIYRNSVAFITPLPCAFGSERQFSARRAHFLKDTFECRKVLLFVHSDALDHCGDLFVFYATENFGIGVYRILFRGDVVEDHLLRIFGIRDRAGRKIINPKRRFFRNRRDCRRTPKEF